MGGTGVALAGLAAAVAGLRAAFDSHAPEPYMDEIFHIPQAQQYCRGDFASWDSKITTLPGLYYSAAALHTLLSWCTGGQPLDCSPASLRSLNAAIFLTLTAILLFFGRKAKQEGGAGAGQQANGSGSGRDTLASALIPLSAPTIFFFSQLFYTDSLSLLAICICHLCYEGMQGLGRGAAVWQKAAHAAAALAASAASVLCRQTNIIWVCYSAGDALLRVTAAAVEEAAQRKQQMEVELQVVEKKKEGDTTSAVPEMRQAARALSIPEQLQVWLSLLLSPCFLLQQWHLLLPLLTSIAGFSVFLLLNKGIVMGDKENHQAVFHFAQFCYLLVFLAVYPAADAVGQLLQRPAAALQSIRQALLSRTRQGMLYAVVTFLLLSAACAPLLQRYSIAHPFLLADNRHYTFYLWQRVLGRSERMRMALAPAYVAAGWLVVKRLRGDLAEQTGGRGDGGRLLGLLRTLLLLSASAAAIIPSPLLEFRYFTPSLFFLLLRMQWRSSLAVASVLLAHLCINAASFYIFLGKPFQWQDGSTARFMW